MINDFQECADALLALRNVAETSVLRRGVSELLPGQPYNCGCALYPEVCDGSGCYDPTGNYIEDCVHGDEGDRYKDSPAMPICRASPPAPSPPAANGGGGKYKKTYCTSSKPILKWIHSSSFFSSNALSCM